MRSNNTYKCIITGEEKYIPPSLAKKKISKFGSADEYRKYYVSRPAAKLLKTGLTVDEVRKHFNCPDNMAPIDIEVLLKLKLVKISKRKGKKEAQKRQERDAYLRSKEYKDKMESIARERANMTERQYIEYATGGPGKCQVEFGGTCARPDIYLTWNNKACDGCDYYAHCLCYNKRLSTDKKKRKRKR